MSLNRRQFLSAGLGLGAFALVGSPLSSRPLFREQWFQFGTVLDVSISHPDAQHVQAVLAQLASQFQWMNDAWHPWKPGQMAQLNQAIQAGNTVNLDADLRCMIEQIKTLNLASGGTFNPAIGKIVALWGFHGGSGKNWHPPKLDLIQQLVQKKPSPQALTIQNDTLIASNQAIQLDLGGYAKGYALQKGVALLKSMGIEHALINAGGDLLAVGDQAKQPWRIGIRHPQMPDKALAWLETQGAEAVFTSGNYERFRQFEGVRYSHILDPRTGLPTHGIASATVLHSDAALADAAATALSVAGERDWQDVAQSMGVEYAILVNDDGQIFLTKAMAKRLTLV